MASAVAENSDKIGQMFKDLNEINRENKKLEAELSDEEQKVVNVEQEIKQIINEAETMEEYEQKLQVLVDSGGLTMKEARQLQMIIDEAEDVEQMEQKLQNYIENVLNIEIKVEEMEEEMEEMEEREAQSLSELEEKIEQIPERIAESEQMQERIRQQVEQMIQQEGRGAVDREEFQREIEQVYGEVEGLQSQLDEILEEIGRTKPEVEQLSEKEKQLEQYHERLKKGLEEAGEGIEWLEDEVVKPKDEIKDEERKTKEWEKRMDKSLQENEIGPAMEQLENLEKDEETVEQDEGDEVTDLVPVRDQEMEVYEEEEQALATIKDVLGSDANALQVWEQEARQLKQQAKQDEERLEDLKRQEFEELGVEQESIQEIRQRLTEMWQAIDSGQWSRPEAEAVDEAEAHIEQLEQLRQHTSDESQLQKIRESENLANNIIEYIGEESEAAQQVEQQLQQEIQEVQGMNFSRGSGGERKLQQKGAEIEELFNRIDTQNFEPQRRQEISQLEEQLVEALDKSAWNDMQTTYFRDPQEYGLSR